MCNLVENLTWRGMLQDATPGLEVQLKTFTTGYIGFDPTATSLHVGNLATIMLLKHFQLAGHKPIALVGGATGMIGDPSFKLSERKFLNQDELLHNQACIAKQLERFLDFTPGSCSAEVVNNLDWFSNLSFLHFLREVGKHLSVNYMMAKDAVKRRLESGISFTEFSYQLMQAYDFYYLYKNKGVAVQMGGADQWGNLTTGVELIRKKAGSTVFALTTPLITKSDGSKFGKSEAGNIWLDPTMTSPYDFYQFWINCADEEALRYLKVFTILEQSTIEDLATVHGRSPHQRIVQKALAKELTIAVHSLEDYQKALAASEILFGNASLSDLQNLSEKDIITIFRSIPQASITRSQLMATGQTVELLAATGIGVLFNSKSAIRRAIQEGSLMMNKQKIVDGSLPYQGPLLHDRYIVVQRGKKHHYLIKLL